MVNAIDRQCSACRVWFPQDTEHFWSHPTNGTVCARCRTCDAAARAGYNRPARGAAGTSSQGRYFGVEMELTGPASYIIIRTLRDAGIQMAAYNEDNLDAMSYGHTNTNRHVWSLKQDSSVHGRGLELVSPKLRGDAGFEEVQKVCEALADCGATVDRSCGLHVHHDFRGLTLRQVKRQVLALVDAQAFMLAMVAPSRRDNGYSPSWNSSHRDSFESITDLSDISSAATPRGTVNVWAYPEHGSVEVRAHAGTTNPNKIMAWIRFGQAVFAAAEARVTLPTSPSDWYGDVTESDLQEFLVALIPYGLLATDVSWLMRFVTVGETRSSVEARIAQLTAQHEAATSVLEEVS
jgi:hypothetical protein